MKVLGISEEIEFHCPSQRELLTALFNFQQSKNEKGKEPNLKVKSEVKEPLHLDLYSQEFLW